VSKKLLKRWKITDGFLKTKMFLHELDEKLTHFALELIKT